MKTAVKEQELSAGDESLTRELPALLVAGGSCSRLCRPQRATSSVPAGHRAAASLDSTPPSTRVVARD